VSFGGFFIMAPLMEKKMPHCAYCTSKSIAFARGARSTVKHNKKNLCKSLNLTNDPVYSYFYK
jgi:hypothetical protein